MPFAYYVNREENSRWAAQLRLHGIVGAMSTRASAQLDRGTQRKSFTRQRDPNHDRKSNCLFKDSLATQRESMNFLGHALS